MSQGKPQDIYYQMAFLDPDIIGVKNMTHFKAKYCIMGGFAGRNIVDYQHLDELNASDVYTLRRITGRDRKKEWGDR